jgi:hypothetical protein
MLVSRHENVGQNLDIKIPKLKIRIYKTIILPVVLHECETWSLTLREEHRLRVFENRLLGKIFGPKRDEVTGEWRKPHNEGRRGTRIGYWWESQRERDC